MTEVQIPRAFRELFQPARHKAFYGGRGSGKSHSFAAALVIQAAQQPLRILCAREIQKSIKDSAKRLIEDKIQAFGLASRFEVLETEIRGPGGSLFMFAGLRTNPDAIKSMEGLDRVWVEEANRVSQRSIDLLVPTVRKPASELWWGWNPEDERDPVDAMFRSKVPPPNSIVRSVSWRDNPWFPEVLRDEMDHDRANDPDKWAHVWEGEYRKAVEGAYYAPQLTAARQEGRVSFVARDPNMQVRTFWDLGRRDATAIWVAQFVGQRVNVLDYIEGSGQPPGYYFERLRQAGYGGCLVVLPHDGGSVHPDNPIGLSYEEQARGAGFQTQVVRNQGRAAAMQRIDAARRLFPRIWFNEDTTRDGLKCLAAYHERRDPDRNLGLGPEHDWSSHGADAFGLMCVAHEEPRQSGGPLKRNIRGIA